MEIAGKVEGLVHTQSALPTDTHTHTLEHMLCKAPPVPPSAAKARGAQVTQGEPQGDCHHRLCLTSPSCWVAAAVRKCTVLGGQRPEDKGQAWDHPFPPTSPREVAGPSAFGHPWLWGPSVRCLSVGPWSRSPSVSVP